jgi:hypothetical protein
MRAASSRVIPTAPNNRNRFHRPRFGDSAVVVGDSLVVVVVLVLPASVVVVSDDAVSEVGVREVVVSDDVMVVVMVVIGAGEARLGRLEWSAVCTTANTIPTITRTPSTPAATTARVV